ncbi:MAG: RNA-guided pseudouridylation complex pseudouridine synthase subunit Cbf5 [Sedimentisphaerales bacterium]|nr:RNA-guided pseudouridylation complex pseudouridine synthase subunit Cbf5 [Sedimentisphaerales bacterium]
MANKLPFESIERRVIVHKEAVTDPQLGEDVGSRTISQLIECGIVNIDKPKGPTSHDVVDCVRGILQIRKAGHCGTLDPLVTGVLPVALGRATRILQTLLPAGKEYVCKMHIHKPVEEKKLREVFADFTGVIEQMPPVKSRVKRQTRARNIYYMEILDVQEKDVLFRVGCQAGTYIRKLVHDMGVKIGVGAHMTELRRTKAGCFDESSLCSIEKLAQAYNCWRAQADEQLIRQVVQPIESAVRHLPKIWIDDLAVDPVCHGCDLFLPGVSKLHSDIQAGDLAAVMTLKDELVAIGQAKLASAEMSEQEKGVAVTVHKVFMTEGTYRKS